MTTPARPGLGQPDEVALVGERVDGDVEAGQPEGRAGQPEERRQPRPSTGYVGSAQV